MEKKVQSLQQLRYDFEVCKLAMALHREKSALALGLMEPPIDGLKPKDLLLVYQGEWQTQIRGRCDLHHRPLALFCFLDMVAVCTRCVVESHLGHSIAWVENQRQQE